MERRSFLKLFAGAAAVASAPAALLIADKAPEGSTAMAGIRTMTGFDLLRSQYVTRFDLQGVDSNGGEVRLHVSVPHFDKDIDERVSGPALALLMARAEARGVDLRNLRELPG